MTSRDFCYWLQGYLEMAEGDPNGEMMLTHNQVDILKKHLSLVFRHEIDPSFKDSADLNHLHNPTHTHMKPPPDPSSMIVRC